MRKKGSYQRQNPFESPRFCGIYTFMRLSHIRMLDDVDFLIIGIPFDTP
ncbi:MAG: hypothetical protein DDT32_01889 [Syntrophomonadaceae bacterium]|nr:hypothetical protein [Bacillota bacterium]MBT9148119.1 hypothetical protein [Bacillota bacterium]